MNRAQYKQLEMVKVYLDNGMTDTAARAISAMVRSAMTKDSKQDIMNYAIKHNLHNNQEFIV